jgi:hypothetical protein
MALSAVRSERRVDSRTRVTGSPEFVEASYAWQKLNSIGSTNFRGANRHQRGTAVWCKSEDRCGAFCGFNHSKCEIQLYFYSYPRAQHSWQNTWVTSKRMIHSSSGKKSGFSRVFPRKRKRFSARDRYVKIVHALRNNTLCTQDVITRRPRFWSQNGPRDRVTLSWYSHDP